MGEFARQNERMGMAGEMMDDALDGALDTDGLEDETDEVVGQVRARGRSIHHPCKRARRCMDTRPPAAAHAHARAAQQQQQCTQRGHQGWQVGTDWPTNVRGPHTPACPPLGGSDDPGVG